MHALLHRLGLLPAIGLTLLAGVAVLFALSGWWSVSRHLLIRWARRRGWTIVSDRHQWPWTGDRMAPDTATVTFALMGQVRDLPVTVGQVTWQRNGLGDVTDRAAGHGTFAVLHLRTAYSRAAVQRRRQVPRRRRGEPEFPRRFRAIIDDVDLADNVARPVLWDAHVAGQIPPWTLLGDELFTVVATHRPLTGRQVATAAEKVVRIADLLGLTTEPSGAPHDDEA